jgi:hypothetical protein
LASKDLIQFFKLHLTKEFSVENILFIEQVKMFKKEKENSTRLRMANDIFTDFLSPNSLTEVLTLFKFR